MKRKIIFLSALLLMLISIGHPVQGDDTGQPTTKEPTYAYYFHDLNIALTHPSDIVFTPIDYSNMHKRYAITIHGDYSTFQRHILTYTYAPHLSRKKFSQQSSEELERVTSFVVDKMEYGGPITYELLPSFFEDTDVLRVCKYDLDVQWYAEDLLVSRGDYLMRITTMGNVGTYRIEEKDAAFQYEILRAMLSGQNSPAPARNYTLPGSNHTFVLPEGMLLEAIEETNDYARIRLYYDHKPHAYFEMAVVQNDNFAGHTIETLHPVIQSDTLSCMGIRIAGTEVRQYDSTTFPKTPILSHENANNRDPSYHKAALIDTLAVSLSITVDTDRMDADKARALLDRLFVQLLTGENGMTDENASSTVTKHGDMLHLPLSTQQIMLPIPEGYMHEVEISPDEDGYVVALLSFVPEAHAQLISIGKVGESISRSYMSELGLSLSSTRIVDSISARYENDVQSGILQDGPFGTTVLYVADQKDMAVTYFLFVDDHAVQISFFALDTTPLDIDAIHAHIDAMQLIPQQPH